MFLVLNKPVLRQCIAWCDGLFHDLADVFQKRPEFSAKVRFVTHVFLDIVDQGAIESRPTHSPQLSTEYSE